MQKEIAISEERINVLTKNLTFANKINNTAADKYLRLVTKALPVNKDFVNILAAINDAAIDASVPLNDYVFLVGSLSDETKNIRNTLPVTITITGGLPEVKRFIASLKNQLPLSEITDIQITSTVSTLTIAFYYKPFPEKVSFQPTRPLQNLTQKERFLIESLISIDISSRRSALSIQEQLVEQ